MTYPGNLYIISAPSGAGKTSLVNALIQEMPDIKISVSHTTRVMRPGEIHGEDYYFVTEAEFKEMVDKNIFLEHAQVFGNFYGTSRLWVEDERARGNDVILEIDWQGARQIRAQYKDAIGIFILPPSIEELRNRLIKRHQDNPLVVENRMKDAKREMSKYDEYNYLIFNDKFENALKDFKAILQAMRLRLEPQKALFNTRIKELLS